MKTECGKPDQETSSEVAAEVFREVCGVLPSGVTVVTRRLEDGRPYGMTVSSFTSVSLEPPLILVCIDKQAGFADRLDVSLPFVVNVLSEEQKHLAKRFSNRREEDRFSGVDWNSGWQDVPLLAGTAASFDCAVVQIVEAGDHFILIGAVSGVRAHGKRALVWCERNYHVLPRPE